jgi:hypothetical protein
MGIFVIMFAVFYGWMTLLVNFPIPTVIVSGTLLTIWAGSDNWFFGLCVGLFFSFAIRGAALPNSYWPMFVGGLVGAFSCTLIERARDGIAERKRRRVCQTPC